MKFLVCLLALAVLSQAYRNDDIVNEINSMKTSWTAGHNAVFEGMSMDQIMGLMGTRTSIPSHRQAAARAPPAVGGGAAESSTDLPASFNSATQWPGCTSISFIRNQAECGSCWAFGATEAFTDRWCINNNQTTNPIFSPEYLIACSTANDGCEGGEPSSAWEFFEKTGTILALCQPYTIPTCPPSQQPCLSFKPTPKCSQQCVNDSATMDKYYVSNSYQVGGYFKKSSEDIMAEMVAHGPVEAAFTVYEDFLSYKSGVYIHKTGKVLGGHAVRMIGYGTLNGVDYWLVTNSWTTAWGDGGYFMIERGVNECGIEDDVWAGTPKITSF